MNALKHTPWSDEITLIYLQTAKDTAGFESVTEVRSNPALYCSWEEGVSQSEFYRSRKAGMEATAQAEVQTADYLAFWPAGYTDLRFAEFEGRSFKILRSFPESFDTTTLILAEVMR